MSISLLNLPYLGMETFFIYSWIPMSTGSQSSLFRNGNKNILFQIPIIQMSQSSLFRNGNDSFTSADADRIELNLPYLGMETPSE